MTTEETANRDLESVPPADPQQAPPEPPPQGGVVPPPAPSWANVVQTALQEGGATARVALGPRAPVYQAAPGYDQVQPQEPGLQGQPSQGQPSQGQPPQGQPPQGQPPQVQQEPPAAPVRKAAPGPGPKLSYVIGGGAAALVLALALAVFLKRRGAAT